MIKEPKLPHKLKWGDRTAARVYEVEYLIGIRLVGYTSLKDVIIAEVHESVADEVGAWSLPPKDLKSVGSGDVFMKKPRARAYYGYSGMPQLPCVYYMGIHTEVWLYCRGNKRQVRARLCGSQALQRVD